MRLEESLTARGAVVHWARDATEACAIIGRIARDHDATRSSRSSPWPPRRSSSTRPSPPQGISAWETDLAELIVQLGDDLPSHILVPAIHKNRAEIREIFRSRMAAAGGRRRTTSATSRAALAAAARQHLRREVPPGPRRRLRRNFAVAETGTLVVLESEGNGRMCLTLPEVLVSLVGIEKLVPTFEDLDVFLQLLPRSTHGGADEPVHLDVDRRPPGDGPQEVHVVLLDNGRTTCSPTRSAVRRCAASAARRCLNACPVYERTGGTPTARSIPGRSARSSHPLLRGVGHDAAGRLASVRVEPLRPLLRGVPRPDRHPRRSWSTCGPRWSTPTATAGRRARTWP